MVSMESKCPDETWMNLNPHILRMLKDTFPLGMAQLQLKVSSYRTKSTQCKCGWLDMTLTVWTGPLSKQNKNHTKFSPYLDLMYIILLIFACAQYLLRMNNWALDISRFNHEFLKIFESLNLDTPIVVNRGFLKMKSRMTNTIDTDEMACIKLSHLDLHYLRRCLLRSSELKT